MAQVEEQSKTRNSIRNAGTSFVLEVLASSVGFISRSVFIRLLAQEYLGLNGLFSNVLSLLSLAELGVGTAIHYQLYAPIQKKDTETIQSLMKFYQNVYRMIGVAVLCMGAATTPFLPFLIEEMPQNIPYISMYYLLYVLQSGISYFFAYKKALIVCDQKQYIVTIGATTSRILVSLTQMAVLFFTKSYFAYLWIAIAFTLGENLAMSKIAERMYPYLREKHAKPLPKAVTAEIRQSTRIMMRHRTADVIIHSTDNILISKYVSLAAVGCYSNYTLVTSMLERLIGKIMGALTASVGALSLSREKEHVETILYRILFLDFWLCAICSITFFSLAQPFVELWAGSDYLLSVMTVFLITVQFYISRMRQTVLLFWEAAGIFAQDKYKPIIESALNLILSIPLAIYYGIAGVLMGTILSSLLVPFWYEGDLVFRNLLGKSGKEYLMKQLIYGVTTLSVGYMTYSMCSHIGGNLLSGLCIRTVICMIFPNVVFLLIFRRTQEMKYYMHLVKELINRVWYR